MKISSGFFHLIVFSFSRTVFFLLACPGMINVLAMYLFLMKPSRNGMFSLYAHCSAEVRAVSGDPRKRTEGANIGPKTQQKRLRFLKSGWPDFKCWSNIRRISNKVLKIVKLACHALDDKAPDFRAGGGDDSGLPQWAWNRIYHDDTHVTATRRWSEVAR